MSILTKNEYIVLNNIVRQRRPINTNLVGTRLPVNDIFFVYRDSKTHDFIFTEFTIEDINRIKHSLTEKGYAIFNDDWCMITQEGNEVLWDISSVIIYPTRELTK